MVLDAERQLRRARTELVKARGDQQMRLAEIEKDGGRRLMKTHYVTVAVAVMLAVGAGYWAGQRKGMRGAGEAMVPATREFHRRRARCRGRWPEAAQAALLPQSDGPARHLAGAEEGFHGHGLHRRL
jgi:hypothetical protein